MRRGRRRRRPSAPRPCSRRRRGTVESPWPVKSRAKTGPGHASPATRAPSPATARPGRGAAAAAGPSPSTRSSCRASVDLAVARGEVTAAARKSSTRSATSVRPLDVDEVADASGNVTEPCARRAGRARRPRARCPSPSPRARRPSTPRNGMPRPGSRSSDHSGRHGPKPPKRMAGSIFQRHPSGVPAGADGDEVAQPLDRQARVHARPPAGPARRACPACAMARATRRRWSSQPSSSPASMRVRSWSGTSGIGRRDGRPSRFTSRLTRCGQGVGELQLRPPPLEWPTIGTGSVVTESSTVERVADVGLPGVEGGVVAVAVAPLVPRRPPASRRRPAAARRRRRCRRSRSRRGPGRAGVRLGTPLVGGELDTADVDHAAAIRAAGSGVLHGRAGIGRGRRRTSVRVGRPQHALRSVPGGSTKESNHRVQRRRPVDHDGPMG